MKETGQPKEIKAQEFTVHLVAEDLQILDKFRGDLSREAFISVLLRMVDSGAVSTTPDELKDKQSG